MKLQIKNWSDHYEIAKSKQVKHLTWVAIPNDQGIKYTRLVERHQNGVAHFGVFIALIQLTSRHHVDTRHGYLTEDGSMDSPALSIEDIAMMIRMPAVLVKEAIEHLMIPDIGWIVDDEYQPGTYNVPTESPPSTLQDRTEQDTTLQDTTSKDTSKSAQLVRTDSDTAGFPKGTSQELIDWAVKASKTFYNWQIGKFPKQYTKRENGSARTSMEFAGAKTLVQLVEIDGFKSEDILQALQFALKDEFWSKQLFALQSLRRKREGRMKYQNIVASMERNKPATRVSAVDVAKELSERQGG